MITASYVEANEGTVDPRWRSLEVSALQWPAYASLGTTLPLVEKLPANTSARDVFRRFSSTPCCLFLDSALSDPTLGRYSYVTADPFAVIRCRGRRYECLTAHGVRSHETADVFQELKSVLSEWSATAIKDLPPFQGGAAGLLGYGLAHHVEKLPSPRWDEFQVPDMAIGIYDWVIAFDHQQGQGWIISTGFPEQEGKHRRERAEKRLKQVNAMLIRAPSNQKSKIKDKESPIAVSPQSPLPLLSGLTSNFSREEYLSAVRRAVEYVHAGDCFQVNLAQRLLFPFHEDPVDLYLRLRERNPATFGGYFDLGEFVVASASPERFTRLDANGEIETRPIKGTRPRGASAIEDKRFADELRQSAKDRAENIMIVDLLRNDLGRVCEYGSIEVSKLCDLETYQTVHHLVSTVRGRLRRGQTATELLRAAFPGGSVTGAPKVRAMETIAELEPNARGPYCGCLGYIGFDGSMDTNILIRTFTVGKGWAQFPVGGGIVADSEPEREYEETLHKAAGMVRALA